MLPMGANTSTRNVRDRAGGVLGEPAALDAGHGQAQRGGARGPSYSRYELRSAASDVTSLHRSSGHGSHETLRPRMTQASASQASPLPPLPQHRQATGPMPAGRPAASRPGPSGTGSAGRPAGLLRRSGRPQALHQAGAFDHAAEVLLVQHHAGDGLDHPLQALESEDRRSAGVSSNTTGRYLILPRSRPSPVARIRRWSRTPSAYAAQRALPARRSGSGASTPGGAAAKSRSASGGEAGLVETQLVAVEHPLLVPAPRRGRTGPAPAPAAAPSPRRAPGRPRRVQRRRPAPRRSPPARPERSVLVGEEAVPGRPFQVSGAGVPTASGRQGQIADRDDLGRPPGSPRTPPRSASGASAALVAECVELLHIAELEAGLLGHEGAQGASSKVRWPRRRSNAPDGRPVRVEAAPVRGSERAHGQRHGLAVVDGDHHRRKADDEAALLRLSGPQGASRQILSSGAFGIALAGQREGRGGRAGRSRPSSGSAWAGRRPIRRRRQAAGRRSRLSRRRSAPVIGAGHPTHPIRCRRRRWRALELKARRFGQGAEAVQIARLVARPGAEGARSAGP